ncbi:unnamed protein product [Closterium sp. NIES-54]
MMRLAHRKVKPLLPQATMQSFFATPLPGLSKSTVFTSPVIGRSFRALAVTAAVAFCLSFLYFIADDYYVFRAPRECLSALNETKCVSEFRVARLSLGATPASRSAVIRALVQRVQTQVRAALPLLEEIKANVTIRTKYTEIITKECADQAGIALYHLALAADRLSSESARGAAAGSTGGGNGGATGGGGGGSSGSGMVDVPYWLAAAQRQMRNCMSALNYFTPPSLQSQAGGALTVSCVVGWAGQDALTCESLLETAVALASADVPLLDPATCQQQKSLEQQRQQQGKQQGGGAEGYEAPAWVDVGLYKKIKAFQKRIAAGVGVGAGAGAVGVAAGGVGLILDAVVGRGEQYTRIQQALDAAPPRPSQATGPSRPYVIFIRAGRYREQQALDAAPPMQAAETPRPYVIFIQAGRYREQVRVGREGVVLLGEGADRTIITGNASVAGGSSTYGSATAWRTQQGPVMWPCHNALSVSPSVFLLVCHSFCLPSCRSHPLSPAAVDRGNFMAVGIRIENTAGPRGKQAVALKISADRSYVYDSAITGHQDTLCVDAGRQYYSSCYISGFTDFIFGDAAALIDRSTVEMRSGKSTAVITASGRESNTPTGIVIRGCNVTAGEGVREGSFGRPWKNCSQVVMIGNYLPAIMQGAGWSTWNGDPRGDCVYYAETGSSGPGAPRAAAAAAAGTGAFRDSSAGAGAAGGSAAGAGGFAAASSAPATADGGGHVGGIGGKGAAAGATPGRASWAKPGLVPWSLPHCPQYFLGMGM